MPTYGAVFPELLAVVGRQYDQSAIVEIVLFEIFDQVSKRDVDRLDLLYVSSVISYSV